MRRLVHMGCMMLVSGLLALVLGCGAGTLIVRHRLVAVPRVELQFSKYRMSAYTARMGLPPKDFLIVWLFVEIAPPRRNGRPIEKGEQWIQLPLGSN